MLPSVSNPLLPTVEIDPDGAADACVIWLHGLGADGNDFVPAVPHLGLPPEHRIRFVFPTAVPIPVTINGGFVMPAWYDIRDMDLAARDRNDEVGLRASAARVGALLAREVERGVPASRIVLAGFSQGGAVALHLALRHADALAGVLALSTYLVDPEPLAQERSDANRDTPILQCHGSFDPMVPIANGEQARERLKALGYDVTWHAYPMQHEVCLEELELIGQWLSVRLPRLEASA